jgi:hypothetical protein
MRSVLRTGVPVVVALVSAGGVAMSIGDVWLLKDASTGTIVTYFLAFMIAVAWLIGDREMQLRRMKHPKARLQFDQSDTTVYVQSGDVLVNEMPYRERVHHLGVVNSCGATLTRMRVVLDDVEPHLDHYVYKGKAMMVRGEKDPAGYFDLPVSDNRSPSRYAAIFNEMVPSDGSHAGYILPYVDRQKITLDEGPRRITYRLEGGDMSQSVYFRLDIRYDMRKNNYSVHGTVLKARP